MWIWIKKNLEFDEKKGVGWWRLEGMVVISRMRVYSGEGMVK